MHARSRWRFLVLGLCLAAPGVARAQKLEKEDKAFLDGVRPILLPDEEKVFRGLKDKADRAEFQKIFWARRDPDLETPLNEYQTEYLAAKAEADRQLKVLGRDGSATDCGRVLILLGKPDETKKDQAGESPGVRPAETWTYRDRPHQTFQGGKALISFDPECKAPPGVADQLNRVAESKIVHPNIDYRVKDGRLTKLVDLLPKPSPAQTLLKEPRQDFALAAQAAFVKAQDGSSALVGLVRGEVAGVAVADPAGKKGSKVMVAAQAVSEDGKVAAFAEDARIADVAADGSFVASFRMALKPGKYTLKAGALDEKTGKGSLATLPIEVPDFNNGNFSMATLMIIRNVDDLPEGAPEDNLHPYGAFLLGHARLIPFFGGNLSTKDAPSFFYQFYDLKVNPLSGKADGVAALTVLKDGKTPVAKAPEQPFDQPIGGTVVGPVPLEKYQPGHYVVQLKFSDKVAGTEKVQEVPFEIKP
jgi:GWxTD domain-containing protein